MWSHPCGVGAAPVRSRQQPVDRRVAPVATTVPTSHLDARPPWQTSTVDVGTRSARPKSITPQGPVSRPARQRRDEELEAESGMWTDGSERSWTSSTTPWTSGSAVTPSGSGRRNVWNGHEHVQVMCRHQHLSGWRPAIGIHGSVNSARCRRGRAWVVVPQTSVDPVPVRVAPRWAAVGIETTIIGGSCAPAASSHDDRSWSRVLWPSRAGRSGQRRWLFAFGPSATLKRTRRRNRWQLPRNMRP